MNKSSLIKPDAMSSLATWLHYLEQLHSKTIELGLERVACVADRLALDRIAPYIITVAGTNGKGTTCRTLEMILLEQGYRVGVYSSPHLLRYTERVRIDNNEVDEAAHVATFAKIEQARQAVSLTYFEYTTLSALMLFKHAELDIVILEVGLGGRLDATNIIDADLAVITSIALDHTDWLGDSRESIGREKAGIFRAQQIAVVGEPDMPVSIVETANRLGTTLYACQPNVGGDWSYQLSEKGTWSFSSPVACYVDLPLPTVPLANAATALAVLTYSTLTVTKMAIERGLIKAQLWGRFQIINQRPLTILDVAHNPHAAAYLQNRLATLIKQRQSAVGQVRIVIGMLKDKDIAGTLAELKADQWYCASLYGERGAPVEQLSQYLPSTGTVHSFSSVIAAWKKALLDADDNDIIVICGSFHTVSEVLGEIVDGK